MTVVEPLRCSWCGALIIERAGEPWRYRCRRCDGRKSSTGLDVPPTDPKFADWRRRSA